MAELPPFRIGARGSPLSLAQTGHVRDALLAANPGRAFEIVPIVTSGDRIQDRSLLEAGGKGLFTKELDEAMAEGRIDIAVHSMKDLPAVLPDGIILACTPVREDPRDALICKSAGSLAELPADAHIGTASLRRQAQLLALYPDFRISILRGNIQTRLRKVEEGGVDATLLAYSGLRRMGLAEHARSLIDPVETPPAPCQGALAITARADDGAVLSALAPIEDLATRIEISAERAFLASLDGSCRTPIAALARWSDGHITFVGEFLSPDGRQRWRRSADEACPGSTEAAALGARLGQDLRAEAGSAIAFG